jgi:hypothetical protein
MLSAGAKLFLSFCFCKDSAMRTFLGVLFGVGVALVAVWSSGVASEKSADARVFELRTYYASPGKLAALEGRFRDHTCKLFEKHGMTNIGYWTPQEQGAEPRLIYILAHKSREAAAASWKAFQADPDWQAARKASEVDGSLLARKPEAVFMDPTDYSPIH